MKTFETVMTAAVIIYFLVYIMLSLFCKKPFRTILFTAFCGVALLAVLNLTDKFTGIHIPINPYSVGVSAAGGVIGVVGLLLLRLIF